MQDALGISKIAFALLVFVFLLRVPSAFKRATVRTTWIASGFGVIALTLSGLTLPVYVVDGWLGGTNLNNLVQNVSTYLAFWLVSQGVSTGGHTPVLHLAWWRPAGWIGLFTVPFFLIERGSTSADFINDHAEQPMLWVYASIYMTGVACVSVQMFRSLPRKTARVYGVMATGCVAIVVGCGAEMLYLALRLARLEDSMTLQVTSLMFALGFYGGVALYVAGMTTIALTGFRRKRRIKSAITATRHVFETRQGNLPDRILGGNNLQHLYSLIIRTRDIENIDAVSLTTAERRVIASAEDVLVRYSEGLQKVTRKSDEVEASISYFQGAR